ncbi:Kynurenine formamidase [uncultured archaeon]|nr:Kynurenine formamidase [uncultured archaeon]
MRFERVYDISVLLGFENVDYPGDDPYTRKEVSSISNGADYNLSTLTLSAHSGTHIDAPAHFLERAKTIDLYSPENFLLHDHVIHVEDVESIKHDSLDGLKTERGDALLFKTTNSTSGLSKSGLFSEKFVYMSEEAADMCVSLGAALVGIDYVSIDRYRDDMAPVHHKLLKEGILILEGINLRDVPSGDYTLLCPPLKMKGAEASPVRALLLG